MQDAAHAMHYGRISAPSLELYYLRSLFARAKIFLTNAQQIGRSAVLVKPYAAAKKYDDAQGRCMRLTTHQKPRALPKTTEYLSVIRNRLSECGVSPSCTRISVDRVRRQPSGGSHWTTQKKLDMFDFVATSRNRGNCRASQSCNL